jgi:hypothetical protein
MKCPKCGTNHRRKDGMQCKCNYNFVFNPYQDNGWTDGKFLALLKKASSNDTHYFSRNQLLTYTSKERRLSIGQNIGLIILIITAVGLLLPIVLVCAYRLLYGLVSILEEVLSILPDGSVSSLIKLRTDTPITVWLCVGIIVVVLVFLYIRNRRPFSLSEKDLQRLLYKWQARGNKIEKLIEKPDLHDPPPEWKESDIYDYGVERILVVQHDIMVDVLVKNGFHAQERTVVISSEGYPGYLMPHIKRLFETNLSLKVFVMHDTMDDRESRQFIEQVKYRFPLKGREIIDMGLFPENHNLILKGIKAKPEDAAAKLTVDSIPYPFLSKVLALSLVQAVPFMYILEQVEQDQYPGSGFG